ncbi:hypothetical protein [Kosakonia sp. H7A]|uniref:hypothetical protein n=1 Tax=Kosakonia sp. H7A TaxID=2054598 RepID=UPI0011B21296|nr:hypothetical protein [Kosakonia sp. H7A]
MILMKSGPVLVEVNPRIMGGYMPVLYNNVSRNNIFRWLADIHSGVPLNEQVIYPNHQMLENDLCGFFAQVQQEMELELLH